MKIIVGSKNPNKIKAVQDAFSRYFEVTVTGQEVDSGVSKQPLSMKEIVQGAKNRATKAYSKAYTYSVGLEAGLFVFPEAKTHYLDVTCCAIFNGTEFFIGLGPAFEYPEKILKKILEEGKEASDAADEAFGSSNIKHKEGIVGIVTKGRMKRNEFVEAAVVMALARLVSKELYD